MSYPLYFVCSAVAAFFLVRLKQQNEVQYRMLKVQFIKSCCRSERRNNPTKKMKRLAKTS